MDVVLPIIIIILIFVVALFVVTREIWCWYWKINARLDEQQRTNALLQRLLETQIQGSVQNAQMPGQGVSWNAQNYREEDIPSL